MQDRSSKRPFVIPKTHASSVEIVRSEKPDSRNVIELFDEIKSCALETQFDFRQNACVSSDAIRNQKLKKLYNERRLEMKTENEVIERLAFHVVFNRENASKIANDGLRCDQLSMPISTYLGSPKDGVHLSKRPDVLLASTKLGGLQKFGLLVCKVLLGRAFHTVPSTSNQQLSAQLHYDHHRSKNTLNSNEYQNLDDLLANSLIYCYEHKNFQPASHPSQILPIAILWYEVNGNLFSDSLFRSSLIKDRKMSKYESNHHSSRTTNGRAILPTKIKEFSRQTSSKTSTVGSWNNFEKDIESTDDQSSSNKKDSIRPENDFDRTISALQNQLLLTTPLLSGNSDTMSSINKQTNTNIRDPRVRRGQRPNESNSSSNDLVSMKSTIHERQISESSVTIKSLSSITEESLTSNKTSSSPATVIPLMSNMNLSDPRSIKYDNKRIICLLDAEIFRLNVREQKRLNSYHESKSITNTKTVYRLIPYVIRYTSPVEYKRLSDENELIKRISKSSEDSYFPSANVSVVDFFDFGFSPGASESSNYIDLNLGENIMANDQMELFHSLIERERRLSSQEIRLNLREKRCKRMQEHVRDIRKRYSKPSIKSEKRVNWGRRILKNYSLTSNECNTSIPDGVIEFLSREYHHESRLYVKYLLAELVGVFVEKYQLKSEKNEKKISAEAPTIALVNEGESCVNGIVDMEIESPTVQQRLTDRDERFPDVQPISSSSLSTSSVSPVKNLPSSHSVENDFDIEPNFSSVGLTKISETNIQPEKSTFSTTSKVGPSRPLDDSIPIQSTLTQETNNFSTDETIRSRDEFLRLLSREISTPKNFISSRQIDETERESNPNIRNQNSFEQISDRIFSVTKSRRSSLSPKASKKYSNNRTVTLVSSWSKMPRPKINERKSANENEKLTNKRFRCESSSSKRSDKKLKDDDFIEPVGKIFMENDSVENCRDDFDRIRRISIPNGETTRKDSKNSSVISEFRSNVSRRENSFHRYKNFESTNYVDRHSEKSRKTKENESSSNSVRSPTNFRHQSRTSKSFQTERTRSINFSSFPSNYGDSTVINDVLSSSPIQRRHKRFDYHHRSVAEQPSVKFSNGSSFDDSSFDFDYSRSFSNRRTSHSNSPDRKFSNSKNDSECSRHRSSTSTVEWKPSETFERLQLFLKTKSIDHDRYSRSKSSSNHHDENSNRSYNDPEQMSRLVQRLKN